LAAEAEVANAATRKVCIAMFVVLLLIAREIVGVGERG
jgi:hypothetical protein